MPNRILTAMMLLLAIQSWAVEDSAGSKPKADARPLVAVLPLEGRQVAPDEATIITDALAAEMHRSGEVRVMERSQMDKILSEQGFQQSGACSGTECAVEVGQVLGIDRMVVGSVGRIGKTFVVTARLVSVATGEVIRSSSRSQQGEIDDVLTGLVPQVGAELLGHKAEAAKPKNEAPKPLFSSPSAIETWSDSLTVLWQATDDKGLSKISLLLMKSTKPDSAIRRKEISAKGTLASGVTVIQLAGLDSGAYQVRLIAEDAEGAKGQVELPVQRHEPRLESSSSWGWWLFGGLLLAGGGGAGWYFTQAKDQAKPPDGSQSSSARDVFVKWETQP